MKPLVPTARKCSLDIVAVIADVHHGPDARPLSAAETAPLAPRELRFQFGLSRVLLGFCEIDVVQWLCHLVFALISETISLLSDFFSSLARFAQRFLSAGFRRRFKTALALFPVCFLFMI